MARALPSSRYRASDKVSIFGRTEIELVVVEREKAKFRVTAAGEWESMITKCRKGDRRNCLLLLLMLEWTGIGDTCVDVRRFMCAQTVKGFGVK